MRRTRALALGLVLLCSFALGSCAESPTAATAPASESLLGGLLGGGTVDVVKRTTPLATAEIVTKTIGLAGGTINLPNAGLKVVVPYGALLTPTTITVTAPAGNLVGYQFAPHGLVFRRTVTATQKLAGTQIGYLQGILNPPFAAYYQGSLLPQVTALELLPLNIWGLLGVATFPIDHFSGYVIATD